VRFRSHFLLCFPCAVVRGCDGCLQWAALAPRYPDVNLHLYAPVHRTISLEASPAHPTPAYHQPAPEPVAYHAPAAAEEGGVATTADVSPDSFAGVADAQHVEALKRMYAVIAPEKLGQARVSERGGARRGGGEDPTSAPGGREGWGWAGLGHSPVGCACSFPALRCVWSCLTLCCVCLCVLWLAPPAELAVGPVRAGHLAGAGAQVPRRGHRAGGFPGAVAGATTLHSGPRGTC
jgi:hypothetical protein